MTHTCLRRAKLAVSTLATLILAARPGDAQTCATCPRHDQPSSTMMDGQGQNLGGPSRHAGPDDHRADMTAIHALLAARASIDRTVVNLPNGIDTTTRSSDPAIVLTIRTHVAAMARRVEEVRPIHDWDPLFAELFRNASKIVVRVTPLTDGVRVTETSDDLYTVRLLQKHAAVVNGFLQRGMDEAHVPHALPEKP